MFNYEFKNVSGKNIKLSDAEIKELQDRDTAYTTKSGQRKLAEIKDIRLQKLKETDYLAMSDNVMSEDMIDFRKQMRDIPQDFSEADYDDLLARDEQGNLTHTVWEKP
tara:strand:- start:172 stop:495 length:324 start_codon:yes stop_codon:yes gene_type:complete